MKKIWWKAALLLVLVLLLAGLMLQRQKGREEMPIQAGMFEWDDNMVKDIPTVLGMVQELGLTRWYQEISDNMEAISYEELEEFVRQLHEHGVSVYLLIGSVDWGFEADGHSLKAHLEELLAYQEEAAKENRLDGIMLDVESYITSEWKEEPREYMEIYVSCMKEAYRFAKDYDVQVAVCIPRDYDDMGLAAGLEELIADACDEVAVMNYGCGDETEQIAEEERLARRYGKELHCILEFQEVEKHGLTEEETYRNKGLLAAGQVWERMQKAYPDTEIIRDYHCGYALREMLLEEQQE